MNKRDFQKKEIERKTYMGVSQNQHLLLAIIKTSLIRCKSKSLRWALLDF